MQTNKHLPEQLFIASSLLRWTIIVIPVAIVTGSAVALFLWLLDAVTHIRWQYPWLLFLLPMAGVLIYFAYKLWGGNSERGNNLVMDEIHTPGGGVPKRMALMVLFSTIVTHLFGGSAGREGTAVQMGGSIAGMFGKWLKLPKRDIQVLLTAGIAAGFGAVFGTPLTGAVFAMEVLAIGRLQYTALLPCLVAGIAGDVACTAWGIHHTQYKIIFTNSVSSLLPQYLHINVLLMAKVIIAGIAFGLVAFLFAQAVHSLKRQFTAYIRIPWLVPVAGGLLIILLTYIAGTDDYLGLGVTGSHTGAVTLVSSFSPGGAAAFSWLWKFAFTAITLSTGFKGGEVTPLFFIGATLGNALAVLFNAPVDLFAGLGFIAVFAGATNTPLACTIMGVELFGGGHVLYFAVACFTAYFFSGHSGIYSAQRIGVPKIFDTQYKSENTVADVFKRRSTFFERKRKDD